MRVERTFAFLDLCGFTRYAEAHGDDAAIAALAHLRATLRAAAEQTGVRVTKWLGDGAMLCGVDAGATVTCAEAVRDRVAAEGPLALRGGLARGDVIVFEGDDHVGAAVNVAARLCEQARPGELLIATPLLDELDGHEDAEVTSVRVAGMSAPIGVHRLPTPTRVPGRP